MVSFFRSVRPSQWLWTACWTFLVISWWCVTHTQLFCRNTGLCTCPGPVLKPSARPEPWCVSFNKKLVQEVKEADAEEVTPILLPLTVKQATACLL
jgi:hypothetical protein